MLHAIICLFITQYSPSLSAMEYARIREDVITLGLLDIILTVKFSDNSQFPSSTTTVAVAVSWLAWKVIVFILKVSPDSEM